MSSLPHLLRSREVNGFSSSSLTKRKCIESLRESGLRKLRNKDLSGEISKKIQCASETVQGIVGDSAKAIARSVAICLAWARDGSVFACGHGDHSIRIYDTNFQNETIKIKSGRVETTEGTEKDMSRPLAILGSTQSTGPDGRRDEKTRTTWSLSFHPTRSDILVSGALALPIEMMTTSSSSLLSNTVEKIDKDMTEDENLVNALSNDNDDEEEEENDDDDALYEPETLIQSRNSFGASHRRLNQQEQERRRRRQRRRSSSNIKQKRLALADSVRLVSNDGERGLIEDKTFVIPPMEAEISIWHWKSGSKLFSTKTLGGNVFSVKFSPCGSCVFAAVGTSIHCWAYADESNFHSSTDANVRTSRADSDATLNNESDAITVLNDAILRATTNSSSYFSKQNSHSCYSFLPSMSLDTSSSSSLPSLSSSSFQSSSSIINTMTLPLVHFGYNVRSLGFVDEDTSSLIRPSLSSHVTHDSPSSSTSVRLLVALQRAHDDGFIDSSTAAFGVPSLPFSSLSSEQAVGGSLMLFLIDIPLLRALVRRYYRIQRDLKKFKQKNQEWLAPSFSTPPSSSSTTSSNLSSSIYAAPWLRPILSPNLALEVSRAIALELSTGEKTAGADPDEEEEEEEEDVDDDEDDVDRNLFSFCGTMDEDESDNISDNESEDEYDGKKRRRRSSLPHEKVTEALLSSYVTSRSPLIFGSRMVRRLLLTRAHVASRGLNGYFGINEPSNDCKLNFGPCPLLGPVLVSRRAIVYGDGSLSVGSTKLAASGERLGVAFVSTPLSNNSKSTGIASSLSFDLKALATKRTEQLLSVERLPSSSSTTRAQVVVNQIKLEENYIGGGITHQINDKRAAPLATSLPTQQHTSPPTVNVIRTPISLPGALTTNFSFPSLKSFFGVSSPSSISVATSPTAVSSLKTTTSSAHISTLESSTLNVSKQQPSVAEVHQSFINSTPTKSFISVSESIKLESKNSDQVGTVAVTNAGALATYPQTTTSTSTRKRSIAEVANLSDRRWSSLSGSGSRSVSFSSYSSSANLPASFSSDTPIGLRKLSATTRHSSFLRNSLCDSQQQQQQSPRPFGMGGQAGMTSGTESIVSRRSFTSDVLNSSSTVESEVTNADQTLSLASVLIETEETDFGSFGGSNISGISLQQPRRSLLPVPSSSSSRKLVAHSQNFNTSIGVNASLASTTACSFEREGSSGSLLTLANALDKLAITEQMMVSKSRTNERQVNPVVTRSCVGTSRPTLIINDDENVNQLSQSEREDSLELATRFLLVSLSQRLLHWHLSELNSDFSLAAQQHQYHHQHQSSTLFTSGSSTPSSSSSKATVFVRDIQLPHMKWTRARPSAYTRRRFGRPSHADTLGSAEEIDINTSYSSALSVTRHVFQFGRVVSALPVGAGIAAAQITTVQLSPLGGHVMLAVEGVERKISSTTQMSPPTASAAAAVLSLMRIFTSPSSSSTSLLSSSLASGVTNVFQMDSTQQPPRSQLLVRTLSLASGDPSLEISTTSEWSSPSTQTSPTHRVHNSQNSQSIALQSFKDRMFSVNVAAWSPMPSRGIINMSSSGSSPLIGLALATQGGIVLRL
jgi:hypothetical protein